MISGSSISRIAISSVARAARLIAHIFSDCVSVTVPFESRKVSVPNESRKVNVQFESRKVVVPFESRKVKVEC